MVEQEEDEDLQMLVSMVVVGVEIVRQDHIESRWPSCLYLRRSELLPNPRLGTPWQALYDSQNDHAFITTTGFDVATFGYLLTAGFAQKWYTTPISRAPINTLNGDACPGSRSLDAAGALGLILHYLNSTMHETSLQQIFAIIPATVTHYITFGLRILLSTLKDIPEAKIKWLHGAEFECCTTLVVTRHPQLKGAFGSIDGLKLPVQSQTMSTLRMPPLMAGFRNISLVLSLHSWLKVGFILYCSLSLTLYFSFAGVVIAACTNAPGSWHDSCVARPIYNALRESTPNGYYVVVDTAFPCGTNAIDGQIRAPLKQGQRVAGTVEEIQEKMTYN